MMSYWMRTVPWAVTTDLVLSPRLATVPMGVLYSGNDNIATYLESKFLELFESPSVHDMQLRWFGQLPPSEQESEYRVDRRLLIPTLVTQGIYAAIIQVYRALRDRENPCSLHLPAAHRHANAAEVQLQHAAVGDKKRSTR